MPYVSDLLGKPVADVDGQRIGQIRDLIASTQGGATHPEVVALVVKRGSVTTKVPLADVAVLVAPAVPLTKPVGQLSSYQPNDNDLYLARDVLDKQIIDTDGVRVVRVNDLELARLNGHFYVANVDVGTLGLLRRLGLAKLAQQVAMRFRRELPPGAIAWHNVELIPGAHPMRLRVPGAMLSELHPADLADIISDLSRPESSRFMEAMDVKTLADTLEEVEPELQASLVQSLSDDKVADVLEEMAPDEAADLLAELPEARSEELLNLMQDEEAEDVRRLLTYDEDTAGGIMNTEFIAISPNLTAEQAIATLRETANEAETIYYIYVTDPEEHLVGVLSLRELVLARPQTPIEEIMHRRLVTVNLTDSQDAVAQDVSKYGLLAVPVVDDDGHLQGIVTVDDALDKVIPTAWKKRLPRFYR
ncbi:MAG: magnesium transporter MgtE N-terminal domain-containing protein [Anaerolineae bacterium]